ncbi:hypothetical protein GCM10009768_24030 [Leucobacter iarius]|uniref:D-alanyl-D-alanine carboxypeptidase-like core domain-containing protein n=1 Tax=Leucobacter iarius TaxID=333963 RepID=A0ABP4XTT1_9MICO
MRGIRVLSAVAACAVLANTLLACAQEPERSVSKPSSAAPSTSSPAPKPKPTTPAFDRAAHSIDDPQSIWVVSNKRRALKPVDFAPSDLAMPEGVENEFAQPLRAPAAAAVVQLIRGAEQAGLKVRIISAYRDYATQVTLYDRYVERDGKQQADTYSARPGHSEHQTGLAVDLDDFGDCYLAACFGQTPAGAWIAAHAAEYGFVIRYPEGKQGVTGFMPEPWHLRYVGPELAAEMKRTGVTTLEEFFGLPAAPDYATP